MSTDLQAVRRRGEAASRGDRRRPDGLQARPRGDGRRRRRRRQAAARARLAKAGKRAGRSTGEGVIDAYVHGGRQHRRAGRGRLRDRLRRPQRRVPGVRRGRSRMQIAAEPRRPVRLRGRVPDELRDAELEIYRAARRRARASPEQCWTRSPTAARKVAFRARAARTSPTSGPTTTQDDRGAARRALRQDRREHRDQALRALRGGRRPSSPTAASLPPVAAEAVRRGADGRPRLRAGPGADRRDRRAPSTRCARWASRSAIVVGGGNVFRGAQERPAGHGPRDRRLRRHAGDRPQRARDAGRAREARRAHARDDRARRPRSPSRTSGAARSATWRRAAS